MGYVIQEGGLFAHLSVRDNVTVMARYLRRDAGWIESRLANLAELVRLPHKLMARFPTDIPPAIIESAQALGLPSRARLRIVELPLATRAILAGIKTAAVINVGTATPGALIGAGGYGQPILTGIRLDNTALILQGAIPAAALALLVQGLFELVERALLPKGLRVQASRANGAG